VMSNGSARLPLDEPLQTDYVRPELYIDLKIRCEGGLEDIGVPKRQCIPLDLPSAPSPIVPLY